MGTAVRINPIHYIITRGALGNSGKRHYFTTRAAVGNNGRNKPIHYIITREAFRNSGKKISDSQYHHKTSSWEQR